MTVKDIKNNFSDKDIRLILWARTLEGDVARIVGVGSKYIHLMYGNGEKKRVEGIYDASAFVSDLKDFG